MSEFNEERIQYYHYRISSIFGGNKQSFCPDDISAKGGTTYAFETPSIELFEHLVKNPDVPLYAHLGIARCSDDDNYNKKIGREISKGRMFPVFWYVYPISSENGEITKLRLVSDKAEIILRKAKTRVYFEEVL